MSNPGTIHQAIVNIMRDLDAIGKTKKNAAQGWSFRGIDDMYNALHPLFAKHGVFVAPSAVSREHTVREQSGKAPQLYVVLGMEYTLYAADGSCVTIGPIYSEGLDTSDKATNKALSMAQKYMLIQTFLVPTEDLEDGDAADERIAPSEPARKEDPRRPPAASVPADLYTGSAEQQKVLHGHLDRLGFPKEKESRRDLHQMAMAAKVHMPALGTYLAQAAQTIQGARP